MFLIIVPEKAILMRHCFLTGEIQESSVCMSIIHLRDKMLCRHVMVENIDNVKGEYLWL